MTKSEILESAKADAKFACEEKKEWLRRAELAITSFYRDAALQEAGAREQAELYWTEEVRALELGNEHE